MTTPNEPVHVARVVKLIRTSRNKRVAERHRRAWERFARDGFCPFCGHHEVAHALSVGQPHFYRPATPEEVNDPTTPMYRAHLKDGREVLVRRLTATKYAEVQIACCVVCAERKCESLSVCYQADAGVGEIVGF